MTDVTSTPPALRWVALFLAACGVLGLFLGFRDQIRKNPPGWYTGVEQVAVPLTTSADGAREAVAFDPSERSVTSAPPSGSAPKATETKPAAEEADAAEAPTGTEPTIAKPIVPTPAPLAVPPAATPRPKAAPAPRTAPSADPVGDILEGQKQPETPATVPY